MKAYFELEPRISEVTQKLTDVHELLRNQASFHMEFVT